ncbi:MAG: SufD family Fe-S cluster assembly protein, partial [Candidatus Woesearchaeota archaeon]|nr:SufD family Fe-S cluster assembly protein [Candidatus Woesearchaeota archaeon]
DGSHSIHRTTFLSKASSLNEAEIFLGKSSQTFSLTHEVVNQAPDTKARVLTKGVLLEQSKAYCKGNMIIAPAASNSSSWLGQHVLLLSKDAKADAIPCLEIKNNDVKAYHAATVAPLDEQHLFYLTSRGISLNDARSMIAEAFLLPLIEGCELSGIRELVKSSIHKVFEVLYASA